MIGVKTRGTSTRSGWLMSSALLLVCSVQPGLAQSARPLNNAGQETVRLAIPSKPLADAIADLGAATGWRIAYPFTLPDSTMSQPVSGTMTPQQAASRLLNGTGISYKVTGPRSMVLLDEARAFSAEVRNPDDVMLQTIDVQGGNPNSTLTPMPAYAGGQVATGAGLGMLGNRSVMDTPFSQTGFTNKTIQDQQVRSVREVLENDPSVRATSSSSNPMDEIRIRGFNVSNYDTSVNGMYGLVPGGFASLFFVEQVELLKGPGALLNGMPPGGAVGGTVNLVTKHATEEPLTQFNTIYSSKSQIGEHIDVSRRFGQDKAFGMRFNGAFSHGYSMVENNRNTLGVVSLGLDYRVDRVRLASDLIYQNQTTYGFQHPVVFNTGVQVLPAPDASRNYQPSWSNYKTRSVMAQIRGEFDITRDITAYVGFGANRTNAPWLYGYPSIYNQAGDFNTSFYNYSSTRYFLSGQAGIRAALDTGAVHHNVNVSASIFNQLIESGSSASATIPGNLYNPYPIADPNLQLPALKKSATLDLQSVAFADTLSILNERVQLTLGVRRQDISSANFNTTSGAQTSTYSSDVWTPAYALVVKPFENVSLYASYIEGLTTGSVVGAGYANAGTVLAPAQTTQIETGAKVDWGRVMTTLAFYEISQPNSVVNLSANTVGYDGEQRNRGVEFNAFGEVTESIRLLGGFTILDARQTRTQGGTNDGKRAAGVPTVQINAGAEVDIPFVSGLTINGRVISTGAQYADATNLQTIPAWTRVDLGGRYTFMTSWGKPATARVNIENIANRSYWATSQFNRVGLGNPLTVRASFTLNF